MSSLHSEETKLLSQLFEADVLLEMTLPLNSVVLKENGASASLRKITIQNLDKDALVLSLEKGQSADSRYTRLFARPEGWTHHKACDAVIFLHWKQKDYEIYVEMKSDSFKGCDKQFESSEQFINYAFSVLNWQKNHARLKRSVRRVVFNTKKTICQTLHKLPINPRNAVARDITYIQVQNNSIVSPAHFCS